MPTESDKSYNKLKRFSYINSRSVIVLSSIAAGFGLLTGWWSGVVVGALAIFCGWMEIRGMRAVKALDKKRKHWMPLSQVLLIVLLCSYFIYRIATFNGQQMLDSMNHDMRELLAIQIQQMEVMTGVRYSEADIAALLNNTVFFVYLGLTGLILICQGAVYCYYKRAIRRHFEFKLPPSLPQTT